MAVRSDPATLSNAVQDYAKAIWSLGAAQRRAGLDLGARRAARGLARLGLGDGQAARVAGTGDARALPRRRADAGGGAGRARGRAPPPAARALPRRGARDVVGPRPRGGRGARARDLAGALGPDRAKLGNPTARPPRRSDPHRRRRDRRAAHPRARRPQPGERGVFVRVSDSDPEMLRYLADRGIAPGDRFEVLEREPFEGPLTVRFGGRRARARRRAHAGDADGSGLTRARTWPCTTQARPRRTRTPPPSRWSRGRRAADPSRARSSELRARGRLRYGARPARPGLRGRGGLRRPRQLRHQHRRRRQVRLPAAVGDPGGEPDGDADPVPVGQGRHRHRSQPARAVPRALPAAGSDRALDPGRADRDGHRPGRVRRRCDRAQPAVRRAAVRGGSDHRRGGLRDPRPPDARLPPLRDDDRRPARA